MSDTNEKHYIPRPATARRYSVSERSISRWIDDADLNFPQPLNINGRLFFAVDELEVWERSRASNNRKAA